MSQFDIPLFEQMSVKAVIDGMNIVRAYQLRDKTIGEASIKGADNTFLTVVDRECGEVLRAHIRDNFPSVRIIIEDVGASHEESVVTIYGDPIDGTLAFTIGLPTSTVILGAYDTKTKHVLACTIGEPASGRSGQSYAATWDFTIRQFRNERQITVWQGALSDNAAVCLDLPQGFKRSGRQILTNEQAGKLLIELSAYRLLLPGSNGLHQAVLAQGNDKMAGAITSAIGGPQDVLGVQLVRNAGGAARAFRMTEDRNLLEVSPRAIEDYDILVVGNNQHTVDQLCGILASALNA